MSVTISKKASITSLSQQELAQKRVLVRVDFNVPLREGVITDDTRIRSSLSTINYLLKANAKVVLVAHLGRPKGVDDSLRLKPISDRLSELLGKPVDYVTDTIGDVVQDRLNQLKSGSVALLENVRFYAEETANDTSFARQLAEGFDFFVQDAFGAIHRAHASTAGVAAFLPTFSGCLLEQEITFLNKALYSSI